MTGRKVLLLTLILPIFVEAMYIRKCCQEGEYLDGVSTCQKGYPNTSDWIPTDSLIITSSESTVKISKDLTSKTVQKIYKSNPKVGFPNCDPNVRDLAIAWKDNDFEDEFYLLYDSKSSVFLNYYRRSVYHNHITPSFKNNFHPDLYCVDNGPNESYLAIVCPCSEITCIRKCCHENMIFDEDRKRCVAVDSLDMNDTYTDWRPEFQRETLDNWSKNETDNEPDNGLDYQYFLLSGKLPPCQDERGVYVEYLDGKLYNYIDNGSIKVESSIIPGDEHCGEFSWKDSRSTMKPMVMVCFSKSSNEKIIKAAARALSYAPLLAISALLLIASALILYMGWNPDVEGKRGSKSVLGHVCCLAVAHIVSIFAYAVPIGVATPACIISGYVMQFSFLAAFFWLNVMCLDMSWTFSGLRPPSGSQRERDRSKFIWYSVYAWGGSLAITGITLIVEHTVAYGTPFKPNVGTIKCWFKDAEALWIFFYGPMAILLLMNLALFVYTSYRIVVLRRGTATLHQGDSARHGGSNPTNRDKQRYILYAKLFSLMGVTWLTEIISWAVGGPDYIWYVTDAINLLRAVFIFIIFCWKPRVWKVIKKRISCVKKCEEVICAVCCGKKSIDCPEDPKTSSTNSQRQTCSIKMDPIGTRLP